MVQKKTGVLIIFLAILCLGLVSAEVCTIQSSCAPDNTIMKLSGTTNAHGELWEQTSYDSYLCCDFTGTHTCDGENKIIGLSDLTNAHAEIPSLDNYVTDVCYGDLECVSGSGSCPAEYDILIDLSLSANTNAHLGSFGAYNTKVCCKYPECAFTSALWSHTEVVEGTSVLLSIEGTNCDGETLSFMILEDDLVGDDPVAINPVNVVFSGNSATGTWIAEWQSDFGSDPEYYFIATILSTGDYIKSSSTGPLLTVTQTEGAVIDCTDIFLCMHYTDQQTCEIDACDVSEDIIISGGDCSDPEITCKCSWDGDECVSGWGIGVCGDGVVNTGETCDGTEFGAITGCSNFDEFTGGSLSCNSDCQFDTSQCTGGTEGVCGDGVVNTGETCDGNPPGDYDWGPITDCSAFDEFTGGNLYCDGNCMFDTMSCTGGNADIYPSSNGLGTCFYYEDTSDNCDDGFLIYSWISNWAWDIDNIFSSNPDGGDYLLGEDGKWHYDPQRKNERCVNGSNSLVCPAQIQLPFFSLGTLLATLIILGAIYFTWILKKKKTSKKKTRKK